MKHSTHDETERTREDDPGLAVKFVPTLPHGMVTIGEVARRVVVRAYATASIGKSGTSFDTGPAVSSAGSYAADGAEGSTIGKCGVRAKGGLATDAFNGCGQGNTAADEKIR